MKQSLWGIDLGGTKIEGVILPSLNDPVPVLRKRIDTEAALGYNHILQQVQTLVRQMQEASGFKPDAIGFGTPGALEPQLQLMKNCNTTVLNGMPLKKDLENLLGLRVELANDANCFALAETYWGAVKEKFPFARMVFGIILGTGVGGGIVMDGKVWNGCHGIAGEWGHIFLDESGGPCYCGKTGCVETIISGPALEKYYLRLTENKKTLKQIAELAKLNSDEAAGKTMERLNHHYGKALAFITNILDPDVIVVGGGVGNIDSLYTSGIDSLRKYIFNNSVEVPIIKPTLGDSAGVFGAAALVG